MKYLLSLLIAGAVGATAVLHAQTDPGAVDISTRESSRSWFNTWWPQTQNVPIGFTGDVLNGIAGDTSLAFKNAELLRINIYRRMAGEQPLSLDLPRSANAQLAAMVTANNADKIQAGASPHIEGADWKFRTDLSAQTAAASSITIGANGTAAISDYIFDPGSGNTDVGHRLDLLDPELSVRGLGDVPATATTPAANVTVSDGALQGRGYVDSLVRWPAPGYIPFFLVPGRWSLSTADILNAADFSRAVVAVTRNGAAQSVSIETKDSTLVFTLDGTSEGTTGFQTITYNGESFSGPAISGDSTYHVKVTGVTVAGAPYNGSGIVEYDVVAYDPNLAVVVPGLSSNLINISTRSFAGTGSSTQIAGFIISGSAPRKVLIRAGGPYLTQFGVSNVLSDPVLTLYDGTTSILSNDDWSADAANVTAATSAVGAVAFPAGSKDAAIVTTLQPGHGYTAHVTGKNGDTGNAIVEVYDADSGSASNLINISTRSFVGTGASIQIGGFILHGAGPRKVLIRAGGPYLTQFGVSGVLADPVLTVFKGQTQIATDDDWGTDAANVTAATQSAGAVQFASGSKDAALVLTLDPDQAYTAQVSGKGATGNAIIEIYQLP